MNQSPDCINNFWLAAVKVNISIPYSASLKERRQVVRSITDGIRSRFSISSADLGPINAHNAALLGFAAAGSSKSELEERVGNLRSFIDWREDEGEFEVVQFSCEIINYGDLSNWKN